MPASVQIFAVRILFYECTMKLLIATRNQGKFEEITALFSDLPLTFYSLANIDMNDSDFKEDGKTFAENARKKAQYYAQKTHLVTLADDSGIIVDVLRNELGVKTRRWGAGEKASDKEWLEFFMKRLEKEHDRKATFISCACLADENGKILVEARGETRGMITNTIEAPLKLGIPLSSVFKVENTDKVHSALTLQEKNLVSHRGKAMKKIKEFVAKNLLR